MIFGLTILDIVLLLILLSYLVAGLRKGFLVTLGGIVGFAAGAVAAFFAIRWSAAGCRTADGGWHGLAIAVVVSLMVVGHALGAGLGAAIRRAMEFPPLRPVDLVILGGATNLAVTALVISMLAFSLASLGVPLLSQQIAGFQGDCRDRARATPNPVKAWLAQMRSIAVRRTAFR